MSEEKKNTNKLNKNGQAKMTFGFSVFWHVLRPISFILFFAKYKNRDIVKNTPGGCIIICNHISYRDVIILVLGVKRKMRIMAKKELFSIPIIGWIFSKLGVFPVSRSENDTSGVRIAIEACKNGEAVIIFPEGTRSKTNELLPFEKGAAYIALLCKAPVIPSHISIKRVKMRRLFDFGKPIDIVEKTRHFDKKTRLDGINDIMRNAVIEVGSNQEK